MSNNHRNRPSAGHHVRNYSEERIMPPGPQSSRSSSRSGFHDASGRSNGDRSRDSSVDSTFGSLPGADEEINMHSMLRADSFRFSGPNNQAGAQTTSVNRAQFQHRRHKRHQSDPGPIAGLFLDNIPFTVRGDSGDEFDLTQAVLSPTNSYANLMPPPSARLSQQPRGNMQPPPTSKGMLKSPDWMRARNQEHNFEAPDNHFERASDSDSMQDSLQMGNTGLAMPQLPPLPQPEHDGYFNVAHQPPQNNTRPRAAIALHRKNPSTDSQDEIPSLITDGGFGDLGGFEVVDDMSLGSSDGEGLFHSLELNNNSSLSNLLKKQHSISNLKSEPSFAMPMKPESAGVGGPVEVLQPAPLGMQLKPEPSHSRSNSQSAIHSRSNSQSASRTHSRKHSRTHSHSEQIPPRPTTAGSTGRQPVLQMSAMPMHQPNYQLQQQQLQRTTGGAGVVGLHTRNPSGGNGNMFRRSPHNAGTSARAPFPNTNPSQGQFNNRRGHKRASSDPGFSFLNKSGFTNLVSNPAGQSNPGHQRKRSRGGYRCKFCGKLKKGHVCVNIAAEIFTDDGNKRGYGTQVDSAITDMPLP